MFAWVTAVFVSTTDRQGSEVLSYQECPHFGINRNPNIKRWTTRLASGISESELEGSRRIGGVSFMSPLLAYGYRPAVEEYENRTLQEKPLLVYLPGFDGTFLSPFLQMPELHTVFDVWCMQVSMEDRSTVAELTDDVVNFIQERCPASGQPDGDVVSSNASSVLGTVFPKKSKVERKPRPLYLAGESFGGILACKVVEALQQVSSRDFNLNGLVLINAALCYDRSRLAIEGPKVAALNKWLYLFGLFRLLPLFSDKHSFEQLMLILQAEALPSIIDSETREAYLGRVALSLPFILPFMTQDALKWRLTEWLQRGCSEVSDSFLRSVKIRTLIVAAENDRTLPSIDEAERLAGLFPDSTVHVVPEAGHASTCGSRLDLAALCRSRFRELVYQGKSSSTSRIRMKPVAAKRKGPYYGMEPRYDNATVGLNPLKYWNRRFYKRVRNAVH